MPNNIESQHQFGLGIGESPGLPKFWFGLDQQAAVNHGNGHDRTTFKVRRLAQRPGNA